MTTTFLSLAFRVARVLRGFGRTVPMLGCATCVALAMVSARALAEPPSRAFGVWPDLSLSLGGGIGIKHALDTNIYGGMRLGALLALEPIVLNVGLAGELGGLPKRGLGVEAELNYVRGPFVQLGYDRVAGGDWVMRAMVGFALFGVQWQHRMSSTPPNNALMFLLRLPLGTGWFFVHHQDQVARQPLRPAPISESHDD